MRSCSQTIFLGFQTERSTFAINGDGTCFKNFNNNRPILFFVCYLVEKVEIILLFESIIFIVMIFQNMPILKVRASNYLARFVRDQAY